MTADQQKASQSSRPPPDVLSAVGFNRGFLDGGGRGGMQQPRRRGVPTAIPSVDNDAALQAIGA